MIFIIWGERFFSPPLTSSTSLSFWQRAVWWNVPSSFFLIFFFYPLSSSSLTFLDVDRWVPRCLSGQSRVSLWLGSVCSKWHEACDGRFSLPPAQKLSNRILHIWFVWVNLGLPHDTIRFEFIKQIQYLTIPVNVLRYDILISIWFTYVYK